jgi:hypothetical protein
MMSKKHKVLIFGEQVFGSEKPTLSIDYCDVDIISFLSEYGELSRLAEYGLVILDYSAFRTERGLFQPEQEIFEKQMLEALDKGACFCILHYDEAVPAYDSRRQERTIASCKDNQIGFRWLEKLKIRPYRMETPILTATIERNEFKLYQERWGASKNFFEAHGSGAFEDVIFSLHKGAALGFAISVRRGKILYLPCQRDFSRAQSIQDCLTTLINSTVTYLTRSSTEIPSWAGTPLFPKETELYDELSNLESKIEELHTALEPYQVAKALAFMSEYEFEKAVPQFFITHLDLPTLRDEGYKEDFWILDSQSERIVVAETKSYVRGLKRGSIYDLYSHREARGLDDTFPALLVVNAHLNANSWKEKIKPIDRQDYELAAKDNIVVMRIEDIIFFWNSVLEGEHSNEELLSVVLEQNGWIEVQRDGNIVIHN